MTGSAVEQNDGSRVERNCYIAETTVIYRGDTSGIADEGNKVSLPLCYCLSDSMSIRRALKDTGGPVYLSYSTINQSKANADCH